MNEVEKYLTLNNDVVGFKSPKKKVVLVLTFMQGPEVKEWTRAMLQWIQQIHDHSNTEDIWRIFQQCFYRQFTNTQSDSMARKELTHLKMRFPDIDSYITTFEQTIRKALYQLGSHEMNQQFLSRPEGTGTSEPSPLSNRDCNGTVTDPRDKTPHSITHPMPPDG